MMKESLNERFLSELAVELRDLVPPDESDHIQRELELHFEERRQHLLDMGLTEAEAEAAAVAAMGSPADIAKPYASVHSPGRKLNIFAMVLGLAGLGLTLISLTRTDYWLVFTGLAVCLSVAAVFLAAFGGSKGYALTFGRTANFTGWVTMLGLVCMLMDYLPSEGKVAAVIYVTEPVKGVTLYKAPDTSNLISLAEGPSEKTAYLIFTREKAQKGTPELPNSLHFQYSQEANWANHSLSKEAILELGNHVRNSLGKAALSGALCAVFCLSAYLISGVLSVQRKPKHPPSRPSHAS